VSSYRRVYFPALVLGPIAWSDVVAWSKAARRHKGRLFFGRRRDMTPFLDSVAHGVALRSVVKQAPCVIFSFRFVSFYFQGGAGLSDPLVSVLSMCAYVHFLAVSAAVSAAEC